MMITLLLAFLLFCCAVAAMAIGIMFGRSPIKGSCGGLSQSDGVAGCEFCGGEIEKCSEN